MPSLIVSHVKKSFPAPRGHKVILHDISFKVPEGEVVCLLGPNGSGKTTLLKTLCGLLTPDEGNVLVGGHDVHRGLQAAKRMIGWASTEDQSFYGRLSVRLNLWFYAQLYGLSAPVFASRLAELGEQLDFADILDQPFRELSNGQKQRLLLARALLHDPAVLLLDEPHQNLDPVFAIRLRAILKEEWTGKRRKTVLLSTHHLEDAQKVSDRWVVLSAGRVKFDGSLSRSGARSVEGFFQELTNAS